MTSSLYKVPLFYGMTSLRLALTAIMSAGVIAACSDAFGPTAAVSTTYALQTVNGTPVPLPGIYSPLGGQITLTVYGHAERRVRYRMDDDTVREFVASGTFRLRGSILELALNEDGYVWRPQAELVGWTITLRYPDPADGPDIVEVYERQ